MGILKDFITKNLLAIIGVLIVLVMGATVVSSVWWVPRLNYVVDKLLKSEDRAASEEIAKDGANETITNLDKFVKHEAEIQTRTKNVTRDIATSASRNTPLPADSVARLRAADDELCKLGVTCSSSTGLNPTSPGPAAPATSNGEGAVRAVRSAKDAGDVDLSGP